MQDFDTDVQLAERVDSHVLITGEAGVGKEDLARRIHYRSRRYGGPCVTIRCGHVPEALLLRDLFGDPDGCVASAADRKIGRLGQAVGGSLLMVDVDAIGLQVQARLLQLLTAGAGQHPRERADVRIIATTATPLFERVAAGTFLDRLYYCLNKIHVAVSPLRNRRDEIPSLVAHLLGDLSARRRRNAPPIGRAAMTCLQAYDWPGNLQELRGVLDHLLLSSHRHPAFVEPEDLPAVISGQSHQARRSPTPR